MTFTQACDFLKRYRKKNLVYQQQHTDKIEEAFKVFWQNSADEGFDRLFEELTKGLLVTANMVRLMQSTTTKVSPEQIARANAEKEIFQTVKAFIEGGAATETTDEEPSATGFGPSFGEYPTE